MTHRQAAMAGLYLPAFVVMTGCRGGEVGAQATDETYHTVRVEAVGRADVTEIIEYGVSLEPNAEIKVFPLVSEQIIEFPWSDGDEIEQGEVLARIRKSSLAKGMAQVSAQMDGADVQIQSLADRLGRAEKLVAEGVMTEQEYDDLEASYLSAKANHKALVASKGQLAVTASNATIEAPMTGVIALKAMEEGDIAMPQMQLCSIIAVDPMKATVNVVEADIGRVHVGQEVRLELDAWPGRVFIGRLTRVLPYLDEGTRTNEAQITLDNPVDSGTGERPLKPGMFGRAKIVIDEHAQVVVVPTRALLVDDELSKAASQVQTVRKAFVVDEKGVARERTVVLGVRSGDRWLVVSGIEEGERIVIRGQHGLVDGQKVVIAGES